MDNLYYLGILQTLFDFIFRFAKLKRSHLLHENDLPLRPANPRTFAKRSVSTVKVGAGAGAGADDVSEIIEVITKTVARTIKA